MTDEEKAALKGRFRAGNVPSESDFGAIVEAVAASGPVVIHANNVLRDNIIKNYSTNDGYFPGEYASSDYINPFTATTVSDIIRAYERLNNVSLASVELVIIINESWDFMFDRVYNGEWSKPVYGGFGGDFGSSTVSNTNVPIYIKTTYANVMPSLSLDSSGTDSENYTEASNNPTEYNSSYESEGGHEPEYVIDVIPDGNAMMFVKRTPYTDNQSNPDTVNWVPINRGTTITVYELGQMEQDFSSNNPTT